MKKLIMAGVCLAALTGTGNAASITVQQASNGGHYVFISGVINAGDGELFDQTLQYYRVQMKHAVVYLDSPGGSVQAGIRIGVAIHELGFTTFVAGGTECASMCADIWLAGKIRWAGDGAFIGCHQAYSRDRYGNLVPSDRANSYRADYYQYLGLGPAAIQYLLQAKPKDINWLTSADAERFGITLKPWRKS
jgi:hypothetical protein